MGTRCQVAPGPQLSYAILEKRPLVGSEPPDLHVDDCGSRLLFDSEERLHGYLSTQGVLGREDNIGHLVPPIYCQEHRFENGQLAGGSSALTILWGRLREPVTPMSALDPARSAR
jgi:hypothetical protein